MNLTELKPRPSKFKANNTSYELRPWTLEDQIWIKQQYGDDVQKIFEPQNIDLGAVCRCLYRLVIDKSDFKAEKINDFDEDGNEVTVNFGGWSKLATSLKTVQEQLGAFTALMECIGISMPELEEIKDGSKKKKKVSKRKRTGLKSSI